MRENRTHGSEGGESERSSRPLSYPQLCSWSLICNFLAPYYRVRMRRLFKNIIITFVLIIICIALPSYSAGFSLDYSIGFNGHFQLNNWTPLSVVLDNRGRATSGNLEVIVTSGSEYQGDVYRTIYTTEVDLPQNSKKRYAFTILIKSFTHELIIRLGKMMILFFPNP